MEWGGTRDRPWQAQLETPISLLGPAPVRQRELSIDNLLVRIHFIIVMIRWTGLAPWEFEFPFPIALHLPS